MGRCVVLLCLLAAALAAPPAKAVDGRHLAGTWRLDFGDHPAFANAPRDAAEEASRALHCLFRSAEDPACRTSPPQASAQEPTVTFRDARGGGDGLQFFLAAACNTYRGEARIADGQAAFQVLLGTLVGCAPALDKLDQEIIGRLTAARTFDLSATQQADPTTPGRESMTLLDGAGMKVATLWRTTSGPRGSYHNSEFGFSLTVPDGLPARRVGFMDRNNGVIVYLDGPPPEDGQPAGIRRTLSVTASYNTEFKDAAADALGSVCAPGPANVPEGLRNFRLGGLETAACGSTRGRIIEVRLLTQSWPDPGGSARPPYINYSAALITTEARLDDDLATFKKVLRTVSIFRPQ